MAASLRTAIELMGREHALMRQNIRRSLPGASEAEVESHWRRWLMEQPSPFVLPTPTDEK